MELDSTQINSMFVYDRRLQTFEDWPFTSKDGAKCVAERLAYSGFFRPNPESEPDLTCCFVCGKELEGWEESDDPEVEHHDHSPNCQFLTFKVRDVTKMKLKDFIKLHYFMQINQLMRADQLARKKIQEHLADYKKEIDQFIGDDS